MREKKRTNYIKEEDGNYIMGRIASYRAVWEDCMK